MKDRLVVVLLALAVVLAGALLGRRASTPMVLLPATVRPGEDADLVVYGQVARVGDWLTIEDLVRGALALETGKLAGPPLTDAERAELHALVIQADQHRRELLELEVELRATQEALDARARAVAASLTPEQRAWVLAERDRVSVGSVEAAYWADLAQILAAGPPP